MFLNIEEEVVDLEFGGSWGMLVDCSNSLDFFEFIFIVIFCLWIMILVFWLI